MTLFGWDASHYDWGRGPMDLVAAKAAGISFMTHKIGEGTSYTDPKFATFYKRAKAAGIPLLGAYYVNHNGGQAAQADRFLALLDAQAPGWRDGPFLLQIDAERWADGAPTPQEVHDFATRLREKAPDHMPLIYAPRWVYGDQLLHDGVPHWASNYGSNPVAQFKAAYPGDDSSRWAAYSGSAPAALQYGSKTKIATQPTCDANAFRGSLDDLIALTYRGDNMALSDADIDKLAAKLVPLVAKAVWSTDGVIPAAQPPVNNPDYVTKANTEWGAGYAMHTAVEGTRYTRQELADGIKEIKALLAATPAVAVNADELAAKLADLLAKRLAS